MGYYIFEVKPSAVIKANSIQKAIERYEKEYPENKEVKICRHIKEIEVKAMILDVLLDKLEVAIFLDDMEHFINEDVLEFQHRLSSDEEVVVLTDYDLKRFDRESKKKKTT